MRMEDDMHYASLFEDIPLSLWEEDLAGVKTVIDALRERGVTDFPAYFSACPDVLQQCVDRVRIVNVNQATLDLHGAQDKAEFLAAWNAKTDPMIREMLAQQVIAVAPFSAHRQDRIVSSEIGGVKRYVVPKLCIASGHVATWRRAILAIIDMTAQVEAQQALV